MRALRLLAELYHLIRVEGIKSFDELLEKHGGAMAVKYVSLLLVRCLRPAGTNMCSNQNTPLQDTNDNFGQYSERRDLLGDPAFCRREITPEGLVAVGRIAREFNLYTKITGSQRIGLFGAQKDDLPEIWRQLIEAGFETGHAYAKALRMAKPAWAAPVSLRRRRQRGIRR